MANEYPEECENVDINVGWSMCPQGKFVNGFHRTGGDFLKDLKMICCKPRYEDELFRNVEIFHI